MQIQEYTSASTVSLALSTVLVEFCPVPLNATSG